MKKWIVGKNRFMECPRTHGEVRLNRLPTLLFPLRVGKRIREACCFSTPARYWWLWFPDNGIEESVHFRRIRWPMLSGIGIGIGIAIAIDALEPFDRQTGTVWKLVARASCPCVLFLGIGIAIGG
jgi:hypothetical protein